MSKRLIVKMDVKNSETAAELAEAVSTLPGFSISSNGTPECDLMFIEIGYDLDEEFRLIEQIRTKGLAGEIFLTSSQKDPDLLLKALKTGVTGFFHQPLNREEIIASLVKLKKAVSGRSEETAGKKGMVISVIGSKGGVGATTAAVNLAVSLKEAEKNKSVVLMDMNPLLGSVHLFLDINNSFSWVDGARDIGRIDSTYLLNTLQKHPSGIHVLPAPVKPAGLEDAMPETMERLVMLLRSTFEIVVMDGCKSFDDLSLKMLDLSDVILVVTELNLLSLVNAKKLLETFDGLGLSYGKDIKFVINRYQKKPMVSPQEAEKMLGKKIIALIANDYETVISAINTGKSISETGLRSPVIENFRQLAGVFLEKETPRANPLSLKFIGNTVKNFAGKLDVLSNFKKRAGIPPRREAVEKEKVLLSREK